MLRAGRRRLIVLLLTLPLAACASAGMPPREKADPEIGRANLMTARDIEETGQTNLYEAILRSRPLFFNRRGALSGVNDPDGPFLVIANGMVVGGIRELRTFSTTNVRSVRRLTSSDVFFMTGRRAPAGGVELTFGR